MLMTTGCILVFSVHAENWERLSNIKNNDKQVFIDSESLQLTDIKLLGLNAEPEIFSISAKIKNTLPTDRFALMASNKTYLINSYYVNCDNESIALRTQKQYTEKDELMFTFINIQEYDNKKDIFSNNFKKFSDGSNERGIIQLTCNRIKHKAYKNVVVSEIVNKKDAKWIDLNLVTDDGNLVSLDKNSIERYSKSKYGGYIEENDNLAIVLLRFEYLDKPTSMYGGEIDRFETLRVVNCLSPVYYYNSDRKSYRVNGDEIIQMRGTNDIDEKKMRFAFLKNDEKMINKEICSNYKETLRN